MKRNIRTFASILLAGAFISPGLPGFADAPPNALYFNDFEKVTEGDVPSEMLILSGMFAVKKVDGNNVLELPGDPLEGYGLMYGPADSLAASARFYGTSVGKRFPEFGVGIGDAGGYRLWAMPATGQLQIVKGDDVLAQVPMKWKSDTWMTLKVQARKLADGSIQVEGKAWSGDEKEPKTWAVSTKAAEALTGKASIWGSPYSSTPIRFDDLAVMTPEE